MKSETTLQADAKRPYRQGARAEAAARTADAIVATFRTFLEADWYDDVSLDRVARATNVTVPTILRHFGSKEGLLAAVATHYETEVLQKRRVPPGDIDAIIDGTLADYEEAGDMVMRFLAQEERIPAMKAVTDYGRAHHRQMVEEHFAPFLEGLDERERTWRIDGLVVALDLYTWKLWRRDRGRSLEDMRQFMKQLVTAILGPEAT